MYLITLCAILLCSFDAAFGSPWLAQLRHPRSTSDSQCYSFVDGPFGFCSKTGYNTTFKYPDTLTESLILKAAMGLREILPIFENCSQNTQVVESLMCSFFIPHCSGGERIYPCKRVCGEFLKQCMGKLPPRFADLAIQSCHILPDKTTSERQCFEPPNFSTNDSVKGPLDRGCQQLILPACKKLGVSNHTLISVQQQKMWYIHAYRKLYSAESVDPDFPPDMLEIFNKYPKCQKNLKKLMCGEFFPPCFPEEGQGFYSICRSVCNEILRDCPEFFRNELPVVEAEFCALLGTGNTSHGYCKRTEWPPPFSWTRFIVDDERPTTNTTKAPSKSTKPKGAKTWVIVVSVLVAFIIAGVIVLAALWMKWRRASLTTGYKKQDDDMAPLETSIDL